VGVSLLSRDIGGSQRVVRRRQNRTQLEPPGGYDRVPILAGNRCGRSMREARCEFHASRQAFVHFGCTFPPVLQPDVISADPKRVAWWFYFR
jgi:hypothetical protein